ncbi:MAG: CopD family protein [Pseudomonadota bacterium]
MIYSSIKALHLLSLVTWAGTMLVSPWLVMWADRMPPSLRSRMLRSLRRQYQILSTPSMLGTWTMGITLGSLGGWFSMPWLSAKLFLVLLFSGLHGVLSGQLRRLCTEQGYRSPKWITRLCWLELAVLTGIIALVVFKPG